MLLVSGYALQQGENFRYLGVVLTNDGKQRGCYQGCKANIILCELYLSVATTRELSNTTKLSVFKSVFALLRSSLVIMNLR